MQYLEWHDGNKDLIRVSIFLSAKNASSLTGVILERMCNISLNNYARVRIIFAGSSTITRFRKEADMMPLRADDDNKFGLSSNQHIQKVEDNYNTHIPAWYLLTEHLPNISDLLL